MDAAVIVSNPRSSTASDESPVFCMDVHAVFLSPPSGLDQRFLVDCIFIVQSDASAFLFRRVLLQLVGRHARQGLPSGAAELGDCVGTLFLVALPVILHDQVLDCFHYLRALVARH